MRRVRAGLDRHADGSLANGMAVVRDRPGLTRERVEGGPLEVAPWPSEQRRTKDVGVRDSPLDRLDDKEEDHLD